MEGETMNHYRCIKCESEIFTRIFPSDGICPACRNGKSTAEFKGKISIDNVPAEQYPLLMELKKINTNLESIDTKLKRFDKKFIRKA